MNFTEWLTHMEEFSCKLFVFEADFLSKQHLLFGTTLNLLYSSSCVIYPKINLEQVQKKINLMKENKKREEQAAMAIISLLKT